MTAFNFNEEAFKRRKKIKMDDGSHQSTPDVDTKKEDRADVLAEFEEYAESKRYMHCLELAQFAEWREWDRVMEQANPIKR